jgi:hypothetical protein
MRQFHLVRTEDISGVSGTGHIAEGVVFSNGWCVLRWVSEKPSEKPHWRAKRLTIKRLIATYMNASPVCGTLS